MATGWRGPRRSTGPAWPAAGQGAPAAKPAPTAHELEVYKQLATLFNSEETSFWTRNNILVVLQVALVTAFASILVKTLDLKQPTRDLLHLFEAACIAVCAIGLFLAVAWLFMVRRSTFISRMIADQIEEIERHWAKRYQVGAPFDAYKTWNASLDLDLAKRRQAEAGKPRESRIPFLRGRPFAGWRLSNIWACLGAMFVLVWLALLGLVLWKGPLLPAGEGKAEGGDAKPPPAASAGLFAVTRFEGFLAGDASLPCESAPRAPQALADTLTGIEQAHGEKLSSLVLLIGGTDRTALTPEHRRQYESNSGLAQARAASVRDCIAAALGAAATDHNVQFVALDAGPGFTPPGHPAGAKQEHPDQTRDRSVQVLVLGMPNRMKQ